MQSLNCEVMLVSGIDDANGYICGAPYMGSCEDCGAHVCELHAEECDSCGEMFCSSCYYFHLKQPKAKAPKGVRNDPKPRRLA